MIALLLNPRVWIALAFAAVLAFAGFENLEADHAKTELAQAKEQWESERAAAAAAAQAAEASARAEEARRTEATRKVVQDAQSQTQVAQAAAVAAAQSADSLRQRVAALVASSRAAGNSAAPGRGQGQQGGDALDVLAGVLTRLDDAAGDVAAYADKLRIAGSACEAQADALRAK